MHLIHLLKSQNMEEKLIKSQLRFLPDSRLLHVGVAKKKNVKLRPKNRFSLLGRWNRFTVIFGFQFSLPGIFCFWLCSYLQAVRADISTNTSSLIKRLIAVFGVRSGMRRSVMWSELWLTPLACLPSWFKCILMFTAHCRYFLFYKTS